MPLRMRVCHACSSTFSMWRALVVSDRVCLVGDVDGVLLIKGQGKAGAEVQVHKPRAHLGLAMAQQPAVMQK